MHRGTFDIVSQRDHCCRHPSGSCKYITKPALYFSKLIPKAPITPSEPFLNCHLSVRCVRTVATFLKTVEA